MKDSVKRFERLELFPLLKVFKKTKTELKRFECIETEGHKIKIKITEEIPKVSFIKCPKCQRNNPKDSLYCIYCSYIFEEKAEEIKEETGLKPYEIKCPYCGKINNRNSKYCLYCGWRLAPFEKEEIMLSPEELRKKEEEDLLKEGEVITLIVDGKTYRSTDKIIPLDIKELMLKIKKEGYSKEMIDEWVKKKSIEWEEKQKEWYERLTSTIEELKDSLYWRLILAIGAAFLFYLLIRILGS